MTQRDIAMSSCKSCSSTSEAPAATADQPSPTEPQSDTSAMWTGVAAEYDAHRPHPPHALLDLLTQLARVERPRLVVDLGSGTGLSTLAWAERAEEVVGIEPNDDMRAVAAYWVVDGLAVFAGSLAAATLALSRIFLTLRALAGIACGGMVLRRRSSAGSTPSSSAAMSISRSIM